MGSGEGPANVIRKRVAAFVVAAFLVGVAALVVVVTTFVIVDRDTPRLLPAIDVRQISLV